MDDRPPLQGFPIRAALLLAATGALACLWLAWCEFPVYTWNEVRLAPAFALRHGINPYPPLGGGPLSTWIYGPVGIAVNLPATFAGTAAGALHAACVINVLTLLGPLAVIFFTSAELRGRGPAVPAFALAVAVLLVPRPNLVLQVADHSAIALGLLSCWWLARRGQPAAATLAGAAALCALAVWAKQIAVFLVPAQLAFLVLGRNLRAAVHYGLWVVLFGAAGLALAAWAFGLANVWLNLVTIPGRLPWADFTDRLALRPWSMSAQLVVPALGLAILWYRGPWPDRGSPSGRFFQLAVLAFITMLPVGMAGYLKIGGDTNLFHSWDYLMPAALLAWLGTEGCSPRARLRLAAATAFAFGLHGPDFLALPVKPLTAHLTVAERLTKAYPHSIWFPRNPVITFYADGALWHSEDGIQTRFLAGYGLRQPDFRRHLPSDLQAVAFPTVVEKPFVMALLAELSESTQVPYWTIFTRPENGAPK